MSVSLPSSWLSGSIKSRATLVQSFAPRPTGKELEQWYFGEGIGGGVEEGEGETMGEATLHSLFHLHTWFN